LSAGVSDIIESDEYQDLIRDKSLPKLACRFMKFALLNSEDPEACGLAILRAAWVCDDARARDLAQRLRSDAADRLMAMRPFEDSEDGATTGTMLVDVLRRAARWDEMSDLIQELNRMTTVLSDDIIKSLLVYQESLCKKQDTARHTVADALDDD
jgi:hypothetical protein